MSTIVTVRRVSADQVESILSESCIAIWPANQFRLLTALDIDLSRAVLPEQMFPLLTSFARLSWRTSELGYRALCYREESLGMDARQNSACLAYLVQQRFLSSLSKIEYKTDTRSPASSKLGPQLPTPGVVDKNRIIHLLFYSQFSHSEHSDDEWIDFLAERGMEIGGRFSHMHCPHGNASEIHGNDCVVVYMNGIMDYHSDCGFIHRDTLMSGLVVNTDDWLRAAAFNLVDWGTAQWKMEKELPAHTQPQELYAGCCRLLVNEDRQEMVDEAMKLSTYPLTIHGHFNSDLTPRSKDLPLDYYSRLFPFSRWPEASAKRADLLRGNDWAQQRKLGLFAITPYPVVLANRLPPDVVPAERFPFKYLPAGRRFDWWTAMTDAFPGIERKYVELVVIGLSRAQALQDGEEPPWIFVRGGSGAGKSTTPKIVSAIVKCEWKPLVNLDDSEDTFRSIGGCLSDILIVEELFKRYKGEDGVNEFIAFWTSVTIGSRYRPLYGKQVTIQTLPLVIGTDVTVPESFRQNEQIVRRVAEIHLHNADGQWKRSTGDGGYKRWLADFDFAFRDSFLSDMRDLLDGLKDMSWPAVVAQYGCDMKATSAEELSEISEGVDLIWVLHQKITEAENGKSPQYAFSRGWRLLQGELEKAVWVLIQGMGFDTIATRDRESLRTLNQRLSVSGYEMELRVRGASASQVYLRMEKRK